MADDRSFGSALRRRREAAGLSIGQLAARIHYTKGHLSRIESGHRTARPEFARVCDAELSAGGQLAALVPGQAQPAARPAAEPPGEGDDDLEVWSMSLSPDGSGHFRPVGRREAMAMGAASLFGLALAPGRGHADHGGALAMLRDRYGQARAFGQQASPAAVLPMLVADTHLVRSLAAGAAPEQRTELLHLGSRYAEFAGWMAQESGDDRMALWWTRQAVRMATTAGDTELARYALVRRADLALYRQDAASTVEHASQAQADTAVSPRIRGLAAQREAQGHAMAGAELDCRRALDRARELLGEPPRPDPARPLLGSTNTPDLVATVTGCCLYDLGRPADAARILDAELDRVPRPAYRARVRWGVLAALAHADSGQLDRACELTTTLLDQARAVDSATIRIDLARLARSLVRRRTHQPVRELLPELTAILRLP